MNKIDLENAIVPNWLEKKKVEEHFDTKLTNEEFKKLKAFVEEQLADQFSFQLHQEVGDWLIKNKKITENGAEQDHYHMEKYYHEQDKLLAEQEFYDLDKDAFDPSWQDYDFEQDVP